ncbi:MAG: hypothetical protein JXR83_01340 [Deltaproteobacteria bacterium]|nr:hypothetical protein [Deltaproteobacteria bacterium]
MAQQSSRLPGWAKKALDLGLDRFAEAGMAGEDKAYVSLARDDGRPSGWAWAREAPGIDIPCSRSAA